MARIRLGELLRTKGFIDELQIQSALAHQQRWGGLFGEIVIEMGFVDELAVYGALAEHLGVPVVRLESVSIPRELVDKVGKQLCVEATLIPVRTENRVVVVATAVPQDVEIQDRLAFLFGGRVTFELAPAREIEWAIRRYFDGEVAPMPPPRTKRTFQEAEDARGTMQPGGFTAPGAAAPVAPAAFAPRPPAVPGAFASPAPPPGFAPAPIPGAPASFGAVGVPPVVEAARMGPIAPPVETIGREIASLRGEIDRLKKLNRAIIELAIRKGLFTSEELRALVEDRGPPRA